MYMELKNSADLETSDLLDFLISQEREHIKLLYDRLESY